jgi:hypothetical protein
MVNLFGEILTMDEEKAQQTSLEPASPDTALVVSHVSEPQNEPVAVAAQMAHPSEQEPAKAAEETAATETVKPVASQAARGDVDALKTEAIAEDREQEKVAAPEIGSRLIVLASRDRKSNDNAGMFGKHRIAAMAAVVALAMVAGAIGGAMATAMMIHTGAGADTAIGNHAFGASVARIDAEILALKAGLENSAKLGTSQFSKTSERLDRIEKAQAEPAAKLAKLSEAVEKLRASPVPLPAPPAIVASATTSLPKDITGSISSAPAQPKVDAKPEVGRLPTVEGWVLRDVGNGGALIEGRRGVYEVYAGDPVPGLGRIDAIRRQDGRWVVVTSRGLIVAR